MQSTENGSRVKYQYMFTPMLLGRCLGRGPHGIPKTQIWAKIPETFDLSNTVSTTFEVTNANKTFNNILLFFYHLICLCFLPVDSYVSN